MTKTISLSDEAYDLLQAAKRPGESFSDVARRLARSAALAEVFAPEFKVEGGAARAEAWKRETYAARDGERSPRVPFR